MSCSSFNVIYVLIYSGCLEEYIGETSVGKTKLRDIYRRFSFFVKVVAELSDFTVEKCIYVCIYVYIHTPVCIYVYIYIQVFRPAQGSSVWLGLTSRERLM